MASPRVIFASAVLISLLAPSAEANRFLDNPELAVDRAREPWTAPIGELESISATVTRRPTGEEEERTLGSGFLVSPCYVLTAHHVVYGDDLTPKQDTDYRMKFRAGTSVTTPFAGVTTATPVIAGFRDDSYRNDWVLLRLNNCIGKRPEFGWLEPATVPLARSIDDRAVAVAVALGYAGSHDRGILTGGVGEIQSVDPRNGLRLFTGSFLPGESGGPTMMLQGGMLTVVGINVAERGDVRGGTFKTCTVNRLNEIHGISEIVDRPNVKAVLDQDKALWGFPNPNLPRLQASNLPDFAARLQLSRSPKTIRDVHSVKC